MGRTEPPDSRTVDAVTESVQTAVRALWVTENFPPGPGGMSVSCDRIVRGLRAEGVYIDVVHLVRQGHAPRLEAQMGGTLLSFPVGEDAAHALNLLHERLVLDERRPTWTHLVAFGGNLPVLAGPTLAAWLDLPLLLLLRGNDFDAAMFSPSRRPLLREAIERAARICVVSGDKKRRIEALWPSAAVSWTPNAIDPDDWRPLPSDLEQARAWRAERIEPGVRVLGVFGQLKPKKGVLQLVDSLARSGCTDRFHLLLVGELDEEIHSRLAYGEPPVPHTLHPFSDRYALLRHYCACDAVAIPSFYDGMPNVLLEAMSLGLPLVASTAGGMGDVLRDGVHGFLFAPGDPHGCRLALARLAEASNDTLAAMGEACRQTASEYPPVRETRAYLEAFSSCPRAAIPPMENRP